MAGRPFASGGGSTITSAPAAAGKTTVVQRAIEGLRRIFYTTADLQDPNHLYQVIYQQGQAVSLVLTQIARNPTFGGNLMRNIVFTAGQTLYLQHGLGHAYTGYFATRAQTNPALFTEAVLPVGTTAAQILPLRSTNAGTYDVYVF